VYYWASAAFPTLIGAEALGHTLTASGLTGVVVEGSDAAEGEAEGSEEGEGLASGHGLLSCVPLL